MGKMFWKIYEALRHLSRTTQFLLNQIPAGRMMTVFPDDLFIVSYPKSGNTWTRFLVGNLLYPGDPITFANVESRIPSIYLYSDRQLRRLPRILKSHDCFDPRYRKVIYTVRDPRDVAVSAYHYSIKVRILPDTCPIEDFVPKFMSGEFGSNLLASPRWGCWYDHVASWLAMRHNRRFLLLRYEDLLQDPEPEVAKMAAFLDLDVTPERLTQVVQLSSAAHMRQLEKVQARDWKLTQTTRQDKPFVRKARSGTWRSELPAQSVAEVEAAWGTLMQDLGYELSTTPHAAHDPAAMVHSS